MPDNREELKVYRLEMAKERLHSSKILLEAGSYKDSIGRSYYAMFTAVRALLAVEGQDFSKHAGVIAYFQKEYVKTGKFDKKYSKYISQAFQIRNNTDYADFFLVSLQDAKAEDEIDFTKSYCMCGLWTGAFRCPGGRTDHRLYGGNLAAGQTEERAGM